METGALGESREVLLDALYAEAKQVLSQGANQLRGLQERLREAHGSDVQVWKHLNALGAQNPATAVASVDRGRQLLRRLEVATRDLEQVWLFLERGGDADPDSYQVDLDDPALGDGVAQLIARNVLEAQEAERTRLAEELHDGPAQALTNAAFQVEVVERSLAVDPHAVRAELQSLRGLLDREMDRLRGFIHQLRPPLSEDSDLGQALSEMAQRLTAETGVPVDLDLQAPERLLDQRLRSVVVRVTQEALRNVQRHADATRVRITSRLDTSDEANDKVAWVLEVRDDGRGFVVGEALALAGQRHFGLRFMRERARLVDARLEVVSAAGEGTTVRLTLDTLDQGEEPQA